MPSRPSRAAFSRWSSYIALIHEEADSHFGVSLPDVPGCVSAGDTLDEARRAAGVGRRGKSGKETRALEPRSPARRPVRAKASGRAARRRAAGRRPR
ncbi:MAG: type II toxin-antitoxin system HicB family antitoxin [Alphaproteobacteria bacterium]